MTMATSTKIPTRANCTFWDVEESASRPWEMFERAMTLFFQTTKLQIGRALTDAEKNLIILGSLGAKGLDHFFRSTSDSLDPEKESYSNLLDTLRGLFKTVVSKVRSFHDFINASLEPAETISDFIARVTPLLRDADLVSKDMDYFLAMKLAHGCGKIYPDTQKLMLAKEKPDLAEFKSMLLAAQTSRADQKVLNRGPENTANVYAIKSTNAKSSNAKFHKPGGHDRRRHGDFQNKHNDFKCTRCGSGTKHNKDSCPARDSQCRKCGGKGHWQRCCFSNKSVKSVRRIGSVKSDFKVDIDILGDGAQDSHMITFDVDSGADISGVSQTQYNTFFNVAPTRRIRHNVCNYDGSKIDGINREFRCVLAYGDEVWLTWLPILPDSYQPIIGKDGIKALKMTLRGADMSVTTTRVEHPKICTLELSCTQNSVDYDQMLSRYRTLTSPEMGRVPNYEHEIELSADAVPKVSKLRPIPAARRQAVKAAIDELEALGIWKKVDRAQWVLNLVAVDKHDGSIRVTTDFKPLNKFVKPVVHPLPSIEEIHSELSKAKYFSTLDIVKFYHNIPLSAASQEMTATITPWGLYQYTVLPMGLTDAGAVAQKYISNLLAGIKGCMAYVDDLVVCAETVEEHDRILKDVLEKLASANLRLNMQKCKFGKTEIQFLGRVISHKTIRPCPKNVEPIKNYPRPTCLKSTQRFLGLMNYHSAFIQNYSVIAEPLRALTRKHAPFVWSDQCERSFQRLKEIVYSDLKLAPFDLAAKTYVTTDASAVAIGGLLSQIQGGREVPIAYGHHTLNDRQRNYSAGEKEALAAMYFVEYWEKYLIGRQFVLRSDHEALKTLLSQFNNGRKSGKFQRWYERLQAFTYTLEYHPGKQNQVADALSRINLRTANEGVPDPAIKRIVSSMAADSLTWEGLQAATQQCEELKTLYKFISKENSRKRQLPQTLSIYKGVLSELYIENHVIMRGDRVVVPVSIRAELLKQAHKGHPGRTRMKRKLRIAYWWAGMDTNIDNTVRACVACENSEKTHPKSPYQTAAIPRPTKPWEDLAIDVTGPFATAPPNCKYAVVLVDYFSSYPEVLWTKEATTETVSKWLSEVFARFGNPTSLRSDNGPQFTSIAFTNFLANRGIRHQRTPNYNPERNGFVERHNGTLKRATQTFSPHLDWKQQFLEFIANFRATPLPSGQSPSQLLFGGRNTRLPYEYVRRNATENDNINDVTDVPRRREHDDLKQEERKKADHELHGRVHHPGPFRRGELVRIKLPHVLKGQSPYSEPREVTKVLGYWTYELSDGKVWNARRLKRHVRPEPEDEDIGASSEIPPRNRHNLRTRPQRTERLLYSAAGRAESVTVGTEGTS